MQKYKVKLDSCGPSKSSKHHPIASVSSNKSLLKQSAINQNKSTLSVLASTDANHTKSLHNRIKSSKHLETHTFTNNTHHNSVNVGIGGGSHNNSKSNQKGQNLKKKSAGKKVASSNIVSKIIT
jgi:hypothetical protein